ncbi:related to delta 8-sphingolipid desaturase [Rhynchosporium agropyri]|uniref:Delta 8-(E)-sphingolipid desaturase n=1 Tax=Rhynchosporium agropyri TaxID=914238 RepID=A0A1E1LDP3_9HELO|nr:related to delta 8-sphingolipid desaturase [Rhynchosporium agropyri]
MSFAKRQEVLCPKEVNQLIDDGHAIVMLDRRVLKLDSWLQYHPGGDKCILHMVGRDATDEVVAFHPADVRKQMLRYQIGVLANRWENVLPPLQRGSAEETIIERSIEIEVDDGSETESLSSSSNLSDIFDSDHLTPGLTRRKTRTGSVSSRSSISDAEASSSEKLDLQSESKLPVPSVRTPDSSDPVEPMDQETQDAIAESFRELVAKLEARGLYDCNYWAYLSDLARLTVIFAAMIYFLHKGWYVTSSLFMGAFWHQMVFAAHDAGHKGITHNYHIDTLIGMTIGNHLGGLSMGWWKRSHNIHHIVTNDPAHDEGIQHLPFMAVSTEFFKSLYSTYHDRVMAYNSFAQFVVPYQKYLYYPLLCFGRFNLYVLSLEFILMDKGPKSNRWHRYYELSGQVFFWFWFGYLIMWCSIPTWTQRFLFLMISHMVTMPLHVQFTLSHFAMSTVTPSRNEPWAMQQLRTTMDVDCPAWLDWIHGGLQFQTIHHLFPTMPRHNLRQASEEVKVWSEQVGLNYEVYGFVKCNGKVLSRLEEIGRQARFLNECKERVLNDGEFLRGHWE